MKLYADTRERRVYPKASRLGISELLFVEHFGFAIQKLNGMYVLPNQSVRNRAITARIDKMVAKVPLYRDNIGAARKDVDSKSLKSVFGTTWNYVGSQSPENFYEFDADVLIIDEYDRCDQANLILAAERTGAAAIDRWIKVGNPSLPGYGIDAEFDMSTKELWHIKCDSCNTWQVLDWFVNFIDKADDGAYFFRSQTHIGNGKDASAVCNHCHRDIDRLMDGEWIAEYPDRAIGGNHISKLFGLPGNDNIDNPRPIILEMLASWDKAQANQTALELFYNNQLGLTFSGKGNFISSQLLADCADKDYIMPESGREMIGGMDIGAVHHIHISEVVIDKTGHKRRKKVFIGHAKDWHDAQRIIDLYGCKRGVIDAQGEIHAPREWVTKNMGWVMCYYNLGRENVKQQQDVTFKKSTIRANRTESLDASYAAYARKDVILPKDWRTLDGGDFIKQMQAPIRKFKENKSGPGGRYIWDEGAKADHHRHADNYELMAMTLLGVPTIHIL